MPAVVLLKLKRGERGRCFCSGHFFFFICYIKHVGTVKYTAVTVFVCLGEGVLAPVKAETGMLAGLHACAAICP